MRAIPRAGKALDSARYFLPVLSSPHGPRQPLHAWAPTSDSHPEACVLLLTLESAVSHVPVRALGPSSWRGRPCVSTGSLCPDSCSVLGYTQTRWISPTPNPASSHLGTVALTLAEGQGFPMPFGVGKGLSFVALAGYKGPSSSAEQSQPTPAPSRSFCAPVPGGWGCWLATGQRGLGLVKSRRF